LREIYGKDAFFSQYLAGLLPWQPVNGNIYKQT